MPALHSLGLVLGYSSREVVDSYPLQLQGLGIFVAVDQHTAQIPYDNLMSNSKGI